MFEFEWFAVQTLSPAGLEGTYKPCTLQELDLVEPDGVQGKNPKRLWCQRFGIARSQKRIAARTQPWALVPVPSPKPWPTFG